MTSDRMTSDSMTSSGTMSWDDDLPRPKALITVGDKLDDHSLADLGDRIAALEAEIVRVKAARTQKQALVTAAAALFGE